jgi:hypothetical protein
MYVIVPDHVSRSGWKRLNGVTKYNTYMATWYGTYSYHSLNMNGKFQSHGLGTLWTKSSLK